MLFKLLVTDAIGGATPPVHTTPDNAPDYSWLIPLGMIVGFVALLLIIYFTLRIIRREVKNHNKTKEIAKPLTKNTNETASSKLCCPKCNCNKIKFETETHKDKTFIKAICEDCGNLWLLN